MMYSTIVLDNTRNSEMAIIGYLSQILLNHSHVLYQPIMMKLKIVENDNSTRPSVDSKKCEQKKNRFCLSESKGNIKLWLKG